MPQRTNLGTGMTAFTVAPAYGVELNCYDSGGAGPAVVLLHGLAGSAREFFPTADALPEYRVIPVDLRGHGGSTRVPPGAARSDYVSDVVTVIEHVGGPVVLVGQSMGAHTAMLVAAERPDLVGGLVLLECSAAGGDVEGHLAIGEYFRSWPTPFSNREAARSFLGDGPLAQAWAEDLEERADGFWPRFDPDVMAEAAAGLSAPRWKEWHAVRAPALVVYGGRGMFTPDAKDAFVQQGHRVSRVDLPEASHDAHLDAFDDWVDALRGFLDREGRGQRRDRP